MSLSAKRTKGTRRKQNSSPAVIKQSGWSDEKKLEHIKLMRRQLLTRDLGLAGLLLWIPMTLGKSRPTVYAYTNGEKIFFCDFFFTLKHSEQLAVFIHETLHVALRHAHRFKKLYLQKGDKFKPEVANICADAIVIQAIKQCPKIGPYDVVHPYFITAEDIVEPADLKKIPAPQWSFEMLYNYLDRKVEDALDKFLAKHWKEVMDDLETGEGMPQPDEHMDEMETRIWRERFKRAAAGSKPGSVLREVSKDLPDPKIPWERYFREFMVAYVMPTTTLDWGRPSRRLLASKGHLGYYEPGIQRDLGVRTAGVIIDTSGSIDGPILNKFISEANAIMEQTGCKIVLICADAEVHSIETFLEPISGTYQCKGGGGTDFRPAIEEMKKQEIDCCVYLTDMCGTFPEQAPPYPMMWATIIDQEVPFGIKVLVEENQSV